tara:strand:+ start:443 stop:883 length:441 start_codon:yes stop_codon:yes gene_type:complete
MKAKEQLEMLWNSHDFLLGKIDTLERQYEFLLKQTREHFTQGSIESLLDDENFHFESEDELLALYSQISNELDTYYAKQIKCISEIIAYYEIGDEIPTHREIGVGTLYELKKVTFNLLSAHRRSTDEIHRLIKNRDEGNSSNGHIY